ncbi:glutamate--cysteine ligase [Angustibacter peucedani]
MGRISFTPSARPTLGVEWELALVDPTTRDLVPHGPQVYRELPEGKAHRELLLNTVELVTGVCDDVPQAVDDLRGTLREVHRVTDALGVAAFCAGTHPFAAWSDQAVSEGERYARLIDRTQWWGRQMLIYGVHVHVGVTSVAHVMPVLSSLLTWFPHLQALSASSPFWDGEDTGYASNRAMMFQQLPTAGLPFQFDDWAGYEAYVDDMFRTGVIEELGEIRWDVRPAPHLGTIENRVCDGVPTLDEVGALTALVQCLVVDLSRRLDDGEQLPSLPPWHVQENKWRAARYGLDAEIILDAAGAERLVTDDLADLLERLAPLARELGCADELAGVETLWRRGASYQRQRAVQAAAGGDLHAVVDSLVEELRTSAGSGG